MSIRIPESIRSVLLIGLTLISLAVSSVAHAAGRTEWKGRTFKERDDKSWRLEVAIYMPRAPDVPHVPMKFEFQPEVYFERDMVDGDKLVEHKVPLSNRQALIESVDVGFLDSGSGKIEPRTRFSFKLTRAHGYEAGEYKVTIHDGRNDQAIGAPVTLVFEGENEVIDRRAMVFSGGDKKQKNKAKSEDDKANNESGADAKSGARDPAEGSNASASSSRENERSDDTQPGTIKQKPGGCGCKLADGGSNAPAGFGFAAVLLSSVLLRRRKPLRRH